MAKFYLFNRKENYIMSVPAINPIPVVPLLIDPRFRYGTRAIPEDFQQSTSRFYLPEQRDSRFWPLEYDADENECFDSLSHKESPNCNTDRDCVPFIHKWCNEGQARDVTYKCHHKFGLTKTKGKCVYDVNVY